MVLVNLVPARKGLWAQGFMGQSRSRKGLWERDLWERD